MHLKNYSLIENALGESMSFPAYDLLSTVICHSDDNEESALTINGKKNRIGLKDFNKLANSLNINEKSLLAIYSRFNKVLPKWKDFINQSFLSDEMKPIILN